MKLNFFLIGIILGISSVHIHAQKTSFSFHADITVNKELKEQFSENGRLYLFFSPNPQVEPRRQTSPNPVNGTIIT